MSFPLLLLCSGDGTLDQRGSPKPIVGPSSKAEFERALATAKAATERLNGDDMLPVTFRERRRDRKARGAAAEALLNISDPPKDIRCRLSYGLWHDISRTPLQNRCFEYYHDFPPPPPLPKLSTRSALFPMRGRKISATEWSILCHGLPP